MRSRQRPDLTFSPFQELYRIEVKASLIHKPSAWPVRPGMDATFELTIWYVHTLTKKGAWIVRAPYKPNPNVAEALAFLAAKPAGAVWVGPRTRFVAGTIQDAMASTYRRAEIAAERAQATAETLSARLALISREKARVEKQFADPMTSRVGNARLYLRYESIDLLAGEANPETPGPTLTGVETARAVPSGPSAVTVWRDAHLA